jgi:hypothetical protein
MFITSDGIAHPDHNKAIRHAKQRLDNAAGKLADALFDATLKGGTRSRIALADAMLRNTEALAELKSLRIDAETLDDER